MRAVAAEAGVSPALVIHHFGSKDALRAACDEHVLRVIREAETEAFASSHRATCSRQLALLDAVRADWSATWCRRCWPAATSPRPCSPG